MCGSFVFCSSLVEWIKDSISFLHETSDLLCFPRSASLETILMSYEDLTYENDGVVAQSGPSAPVATAANLGGYTSQMYLIEQEIIANVATPTKEDEKPAENDCKTLRDGKKITAWSDVTIIEVLTECIERLKENVSVFKEIEKSLAVMCDGFAASVKMSNLYVCTPISKKLTYSPNLTVCPLCQSEAPAELIVIDHKLDFVKEELLDKAWYSMLRTLDRHFDDFVDDFCDNFSLFACLVQEYSRRSENRIQASLTYDEAEKSKLMDLMIAASACDEAVLPPEMCTFVAKSLRQVVVKAFLRRYRNYEANEILRTIFADSNTFSLVIQDLPVNLLTMDQFFVAYESFLRVLALPEGEDLDCCMVMNVLDVARLEPELTSSTVMSFLTLILSTYRDSKSLTYRNPEMCSVFNSHVRFLLLCNEMAHFESGLTLLINEYFADCSQLLKETVSDLNSTPKIDMLRFEVVCNCLDCLNDCTPSSDGIAIALTLYYICLHRKVDLWKAAMEKEGVVPTVEELEATVDKAYSFAAVRTMMRRDIDPRQWCTLLEQYYLIVRCLSNFFIETKCDIVENTLLLLLIAGLSYFNSTYLDERAKKVMDDYATEIKWNTVVPTLEIINCFISFIASAKRKQKVFFIRVVVQLRWTEFVRSSLETLDSSMPVIARALELLFSCIFCNDAQPHSSSLVDLLDLFKLVPKATIVGENRQQLLLYFSRRATCCHLCREESAPQNAAFRALKHLMCFDGVGGQHTCAEVCTDSQRALLDVILEIFKHRCRDSPAKKLIDAQWTPLLEDICACINLAENRFVHINRGKILFNSVVSYLVDGDGNKAFLIDATIQWMKTSPASAYLIYVLNSLSENLSSKPDVCLSLAEECLKAYFANLISASWSDVVANFSLTSETSNDLPAKCRQKCLYWVLYSHLLSRLYSDDSDTDTADLALQCVSVCNELIDKQADELLCVMYLLLLVNTLSAMVERCCTLTVGVFKQFLLLCGILEVFIVTRLQSDLSLQDVYAEEDKDAISMQTLKETAIFEAYTNTIDLAAEMMTHFQESGGMVNLHTFVSKVALALYSERCINDRCIA
ncbi:Predicted CDS Pa 7 8930 [Trichuris trichiura]|uniref:Predicted CDS Pa 7 8930 n=1 Tax=Trichuris trichiura TaxID=36087 RepID=A0A077ZAJ6_TRITR|nr:Predicted CDS Pa 7 8930 [Trichuris trichiura]